MTSPFSVRCLLARLSFRSSPQSLSLPSTRPALSMAATRPTMTSPTSEAAQAAPGTRSLSTTSPRLGKLKRSSQNSDAQAKRLALRAQKAKIDKRNAEREKSASESDPKIIGMKQVLQVLSPHRIPPPLRMGRNRWMRHWTIHRAWLLFRRQQRARREGDLMRQYQGIQVACEELRLSEGPATRPQGYLYRVAMEKRGLYGHKAIPMDYSRAQTDSPAKIAWDHNWKR